MSRKTNLQKMLKIIQSKCIPARACGLQITCTRTRYKRSDTPDPDLDLLKPKLFYEGDSTSQKTPSPLQRTNNLSRIKHPEREKFPKQYSLDPVKGKEYAKLPIKIPLEAGKMYAWCTCGYSHKQPFCDGAHKRIAGTAYVKTKPVFKPHRFSVTESKEYYLCNCKQTNDRPFCDGSHKALAVDVSPIGATEATVEPTDEEILEAELAEAEQEKK